MCGRFTHLYNWRQLHRLLTLTSPSIEIPLRYNLAPSQVAPVVRDTSERERTLAMLRWGFAVSAAASSGAIINARSETLAQKPTFRDAFHRRRCVVPISGFYEWEVPRETDLFGVSRPVAGDPPKQPHYITAVDGEPLLLAGLWSPGDGRGPRWAVTLVRDKERPASMEETPRVVEWDRGQGTVGVSPLVGDRAAFACAS